MTVDQLGDSRPQPEPEIIKWQKLPDSDDELSLRLRSLTHTIRTTFNDYALIIVPGSDSIHSPGIGRQQSIRIPHLEDIITLLGLEKGINWKLQDVVQGYSRWSEGFNDGTAGLKQNFGGFNDQGGRVLGGEIRVDLTSYRPDLGFSQLERLKYYGASSSVGIRKYKPEESEITFGLGYSQPIVVGINKPAKFLTCWDMVENFGIYYHVPFFQLGEGDPVQSCVTVSYEDLLEGIDQKPQDTDILTFLREEEKKSDNVYNNLKTRLDLDKMPQFERPSALSINRLDEIARFLESRYRDKRGITETSYKDHVDRITAFRNHVWQPLRQPARREEYPYLPDLSYLGLISPRELWRKDQEEADRRGYYYKGHYPKGLGPFDPGPHNPSAPNDPRGPDPRGLVDPRGPR